VRVTFRPPETPISALANPNATEFALPGPSAHSNLGNAEVSSGLVQRHEHFVSHH
jgi:hypothetical protein